LSAAPRDPLVCDDPIAERRYDYARAAARDGDWAAAAEVLEQALQLAPDWAPAWFALGEARERLGDQIRAVDAFSATLAADPGDAQGARGRLALLGEGSRLRALSPAYVARLFDDYAVRFDAHLASGLGYRGPELIVAALERLESRRFSHCIDLGCGTGLAGVALRGRVDTLIGVDLSAAMIAKARETRLYDELKVGDAVAFLATSAARGADLVVAADVFGYVGDLDAVFAAAARALGNGGRLAFSVETHEGDGYRLGPAMRFTHSAPYVRETAIHAGLRELLLAPVSIRREAGLETPGLLGVFAQG
jgi:predicted TPR repeat methyltransferase